MPKNGIPGGDYPPGKKTSSSKDTANEELNIPKGLSGMAERAGFEHEEEVVTSASQAEQAAKARAAIMESPAETKGPSIDEEQANARAALGGGRDAGRKERTRGVGGSKRGVRGGKTSKVGVEEQSYGVPEKASSEVNIHQNSGAEIRDEYYRLRDTNLLKSGTDGFVMSLEEYVAQKNEESSAAVTSTETAPDTSPEPLPADATPLERQRRMRSDIVNDAVQKMEAQAVKAEVAKKTYFDALKTYQHNRGFAGIAAESLVGDTLLTPKALKDLRHTWVYERALSAATQRAATDIRLKEKPATREAMLERLKAKHEAKGTYNPEKHDIQKRYERMVTLKSVVTGQEEEELSARTEGFSTRDKKTLELMFERYKKVPPALRIFGTSAVLLGGAALLAGSPLGLAALGMAGTSAGLRYWKEKAKNPEMQKWLNRVLPIASIAGAAGALVDYGIQFAHKRVGTEKKAEELLGKKEGLGDLDSVENLEHLSKERRKALVVKENIARHGRLARVATSLGLGFLLGHLTSGAGHEATSGSSVDHSHTPTGGDTSHAAPSPEGAVAGHTGHVQIAENTTPHMEPYSVTIKPGEGMDKLFVELRDHYKTIYPNPDASTVPPGIRHILNAHSGDELSREFGFVDDNNSSYIMKAAEGLKAGDTLGFDAHGSLVFTPHGEAAQSVDLLQEVRGGDVASHHLTTAEQQGHFLRHTEASMAGTHPNPEAHVTSSTTVPSTENTDAMLNNLQVVHPSEPVDHEVITAVPVDTLDSQNIHSTTFPDHLSSDTPPPVAVEQVSVVPETPHSATAPVSVPEHSVIAPEASAAVENGSFLNIHQVPVVPTETHLYAVPDASSQHGERLFMFGSNGSDDELYREVIKQAKLHPGVRIYFQSPVPTEINGTPQNFIASGIYTPDSGFVPSGGPEDQGMIGLIDPQIFTSRRS